MAPSLHAAHLQLVADEVQREMTQQKQSDDLALDAVNTDDENDEEEYEAWKVRELKRMKRDRDERDQYVHTHLSVLVLVCV